MAQRLPMSYKWMSPWRASSAVLLQKGRPVIYASRTLISAERVLQHWEGGLQCSFWLAKTTSLCVWQQNQSTDWPQATNTHMDEVKCTSKPLRSMFTTQTSNVWGLASSHIQTTRIPVRPICWPLRRAEVPSLSLRMCILAMNNRRYQVVHQEMWHLPVNKTQPAGASLIPYDVPGNPWEKVGIDLFSAQVSWLLPSNRLLQEFPLGQES